MNKDAYFNYSKKERTGILALTTVLLITAAVPKFFHWTGSVNDITAPQQVASNDMESVKPATVLTDTTGYKRPLQKPYVVLTSNNVQKFSSARQSFRKTQLTIEVNKADTSDFISLPFIGSKLAARIVLFREKLGGFHCKQQLAEVYGIADSVYHIIEKRLICDSTAIKKLNINAVDDVALRQHPYIRWKFATALINFRQQHGAFNSLRELEKIKSIDSASLEKMMPYLTLR